MSGNATVVQVGSVSVSTSGALTGQLLAQFASALSVASQATVPSTTVVGTLGSPIVLPGPTGSGVGQTLVVPVSDQGVISVPGGYQFIYSQGTNQVAGADSTQAVIGSSGPLNYSGGAGTVMATGTQAGTGTVVDTTAGAQFGVANAGELIFGLADSQGYGFDSGFSTLVATGKNGSVSVDGTGSVVSYFVTSADYTQTGGSATFIAGAGGNTLNAAAGNTVFWGSSAGDMVTLGSGNAEILNSTGKSTITAGSGADTVFAQGGVNYTGGSGTSFFIGGTGMSTVYTAKNEVAFGGKGGDVFSVQAGGSLLFVGTGGADTISGGTTKPTMWGNNNESLTAVNSVHGGIYIMYGNNDNLNMASAGGASYVIGVEGGPFAGTQNITMSGAGNDTLVLHSASEYGLANAGAHTITITNWQATDVLDLTFTAISGQDFGYQVSDQTAAQKALGSSSSVTLADGTKLVFQGAKPTSGQIWHV